MFFKKKKFDCTAFKNDLIKDVDDYLNLSFSKNYNLREELETLRNKLFNNNIEQSQYYFIKDFLDNLNQVPDSKEKIELFIYDIHYIFDNNLLLNKKKNDIDVINQIEIFKLYNSIKINEALISNINEKIATLNNTAQNIDLQLLVSKKNSLLSSLKIMYKSFQLLCSKVDNKKVYNDLINLENIDKLINSYDNYVNGERINDISEFTSFLESENQVESNDLNDIIKSNNSNVEINNPSINCNTYTDGEQNLNKEITEGE